MTGKNIVLSGQISQTITADLENVTPMEAIRHVADTGGLQIRDAGDTLFVAGDGGEKSAGCVRCFYLSYADAEEVAENLKTVLKTGSASANAGANLVVVRASPGELMGAEMLISALDKPERQPRYWQSINPILRNWALTGTSRALPAALPMKKGKANIPTDDM